MTCLNYNLNPFDYGFSLDDVQLLLSLNQDKKHDLEE